MKEKYGYDVEELNKAWNKCYLSWKDVWPGKLPRRPYSEMMAFEDFLHWRSSEHMVFRSTIIREADPHHIITAHSSEPSFRLVGDNTNQALFRGNDFDLVKNLDGYGCSHFPFWFKICDEEFGIRVEATRSALNDKQVLWVSELQGGSARQGFSVFPSVQGKPQQRWVWNAIGRGAKTVVFWCWRDEVFGTESSGFGLNGLDGLAKERIDQMRITGKLLLEHRDKLLNYVPDEPKIGVWFDSNTYNLEWAEYSTVRFASGSINGYLLALERVNLPYCLVESMHTDVLANLKLLILPFPIIVPEKAASDIIKFVKNGGTLLVEGEVGAYDVNGFYSYPNERQFASILGIENLGRRQQTREKLTVILENVEYHLNIYMPLKEETLHQHRLRSAGGFYTPLKAHKDAHVFAVGENEECLAMMKTFDKGRIYSFANFIGLGYNHSPNDDFEQMLKRIAINSGAGCDISLESKASVQWRSGQSGDRRLLFIINPGDKQKVRVTIPSKSMMNLPKFFAWKKNLYLSKQQNKSNSDYHISLIIGEGDYEIIEIKQG